MVKIGRGGMMNYSRGHQNPRPLFPPGELPLFGPPPAYNRRNPGNGMSPLRGPPLPGPRGPPMTQMRPLHLGPPPHHMNMNCRPRPGPPMPLLQSSIMPPRPPNFMRGRPMPRLDHGKKIEKNMKGRNKKNKFKVNAARNEGEHYCEVCDKSWETAEELQEHISEHVSCHIGDCKFAAAEKVVALHIKLQHDSGMFDRIIKSYDEEEIKKWREERRRNFPTQENIEKKKTEMEVMKMEGIISTAENKKPFNNKKMEGYTLTKGSNLDKNTSRKRNRKRKQRDQHFLSTASLPEDVVNQSPAFPKENEKDFSDEEWTEEDKIRKKDNACLSKALLALSTSYASDSEEEETCQIQDKKSDDDGPPSEEAITREADSLPNIHIDKIGNIKPKSFEKTVKKISVHTTPKAKNWTSLKKRPLTLLEKLISKEIRQERNYILQCIKFIIKENYFDNRKPE